MTKADQMRNHAENCGTLAEKTEKPADRARFKRMEDAWKELAKTQDWLDGHAPELPREQAHELRDSK
jgi:hypothetical protein